MPNSPNNIEDEEAWCEKELNEALEAVDELKHLDEDSKRTMKDVLIHEEIPS